jgi:RHS repeat-associated protein
MFSTLRKVAWIFVLLLPASTIMAQVATGTYPYGTYDNLGRDTMNVGNLNVHFNFPVLNKTGRGIPFTYNVSYDSSIWMPVPSGSSMVWQPVLNWGWGGQTEAGTGYLSAWVSISTCTTEEHVGGSIHPVNTGSEAVISGVVYHDAWGGIHPFPGTQYIQSGSGSGLPVVCTGNSGAIGPLATDGSGYQFDSLPLTYSGIFITGISTTGTISNKSNTSFTVPTNMASGTASATDSNGNEITENSSGQFTDTTGNVVLTVAGTAPSPETFTYTDTTGTARTVTVSYTTQTVQTAFGCSGVGEYGPTSIPLVSSISYPDGSSYSFAYEATPGYSGKVTGRIASVTLPQGGTISYTYTGGSNGIECADGSTSGLTRSIAASAGSAASTWTYSRSITGTGTSSTAVVDGLSNSKNYTFVEASNQPSGTTAEYYETSRSIYQGAASGTPVVALNTCYNGAASPCTTTLPTLPLLGIDTYNSLNGSSLDGATVFYNTSGAELEMEVYDFGTSSSRGSALSDEIWMYDGSSTTLPTLDELFDGGGRGSGHLAAETNYTYDGTTPTTSSGVPQHVSVTNPRGNLTQMTQYANGTTSYVTNTTYEDTGSVLTIAPPTGTTTLTYDSTFVYNTGATLPTPSSGVSIGAGQSYDTTYTGLPLISTDPNSQPTTISTSWYDSMLRPTEIQYPDGGETTWSYSPTTLTTNTYQTSGVYSTSEVQLDSYGRQSRVEMTNGQSGNPYYQTDTCYDANGNAAFVSYPYQSTGFGATKVCSGAGDTYYYDVLGRVTSVVRANGETRTFTYSERATKSVDENGVTRISQVDGLGRPTIVCEISSSTLEGVAPSSCGTDISGTGFSTTFSYALATHTTTITQGAQTRVFQNDWLGRPISVTEPESGTTTYSYSYNSTGLVVTRQKPTANQTSSSVLTTTTTQYDALNRVVSISYTDGTPTKTFAYDSSTGVSTGTGANFTDLTQANLKGRLSLASVSNAGTAYSYDPMGRTSYLDECLPSGCGTTSYNKQLHYTYDWAGNLLTSTDGAGVTSTYTVSLANELQSLTSSLSNSTNPANIVSSVQNGPNGPTSYSLGSGLSSVFGYDSLGRLNGGWVCSGSTSASCSGGTQVYGFMNGWSGVQLASSTDTVLGQTSTYGYDEFNRLASRTVTSGSPVNNFSYVYDRYGNRWAQNVTAGSGPQPNYSFTAATNQISGSGYAYDAAGNMTNDTFHTYTYDADGNITAVDGGSTASYVYNAMNQRVQAAVGSTTTAFVFSQAGQRVSEWNGALSAQIQGKYYWGGRPVAYYSGGNAHFEHQDWLGTERMRTTYNGSVEGSFISLPFGDGQSTSGTDGDANHYAELDHDNESDTEYAQFRQYSNEQGRWHSPDPYSGSYDFSNPQSMNRYAYVADNPLSLVDPQGQQLFAPWMCGNQCNISGVSLDPSNDGPSDDWYQAFSSGMTYNAGNGWSAMFPSGTSIETTCAPTCYSYSSQTWNDTMSNGYGDGISINNGNIMATEDGGQVDTGSVFSSIAMGWWVPSLSSMPTGTVSISGGGGGGGGAPNNPPAPPATPPQQQGNSWSHPFTPPTCSQIGHGAAADLAISFAATGGGKTPPNPVSALFGWTGMAEATFYGLFCQ